MVKPVKITASIVTYFTPDTDLMKAVKCALDSSISLLYIIDNTSNDVLREIEKSSDRIRYIHNANTGYGGGHNIAIRDAMKKGAEYHVVLNPDIYFEHGTIERLAEYMDANPDVGQAMPKVTYPDGSIQYLCKLLPTPFDLLVRRFFPKGMFAGSRKRFQLEFADYGREMNVPFLSGCFMFLRVDALKTAGLFDERFFMYGEDIDLSRRIHERFRTMFYPGASIVHNHAAASYKSFRMLKVHIANIVRYFNKWGWFIDADRRKTNKSTLKSLGLSDEEIRKLYW